MTNLDKVWEAFIAVLLGGVGGFARLLHERDRKKLKWVLIVSELFISGFTGLMVLTLVRLLGLGGDVIAFVCGMAGWIRPRILGALEKPAEKTLGLNTAEAKHDKDNV